MISLNNFNYLFIQSINQNVEEDNLVYNLLYFSYIFFFGTLFLTNDFFLPYQIFLFFAIPLSIMPIYISLYRNVAGTRQFKFELSLINPLKTLSVFRSHIFICACIFATVISFSSWLYPAPSAGWFLDFFKYLISILFFLAITSRIAGRSSRSMEIICAILCLIAAVNAALNVYAYFSSLPNLESFSVIRFSPSFGRAADHFPTTSALTYALFFGISCCLAIQRNSIISRIIASICGLIFLSALILTQSRGPLVASLISLIIIAFFSTPRLRETLVILIGLIASGFLLLPNVGISALQRGENARFEVWGKFLSLAILRPILGYGERIEFQVAIRNAEIIGHAHNIFISALVRGGIAACLSLIATIALALKYTTYYAKINFNFIPLCGIIIISISGMVDFDLIVFLSDWQWPSMWLVIGLAVSTEVSVRF